MRLTNFLSLVHCKTSSSQTSHSTEGAIFHCFVIALLLRRWWLLCISALLIPSLLLAIARWLIVASTDITSLVRIACVVALRLIGRVRVLEGALAGLWVDKEIALVSLVPFSIPGWGQRRVLRLLLRVVGHIEDKTYVLLREMEFD